MPLINCEVELILTWFKDCVLIRKATKKADYDADPVVPKINNPETAIFLKTGFNRTIKWNKYRS